MANDVFNKPGIPLPAWRDEGGGGGGSDLPDITPEVETTILEEQTFSPFEQIGNDLYAYYGDEEVTLVNNEYYAVTWDGSYYNCKAMVGDNYGMLGNFHLMSPELPDTGEPFALEYYTDDPVEFDLFTTDSSESHTFGITLVTAQNPPEGTALSVKNGEWEASGQVLPEIGTSNATIFDGTLTFTSFGGGMYISLIEGFAEIVVGGTYITDWAGTEYECVATTIEGFACFGNLAILGGPDTEEPFIILDYPGLGIVAIQDVSDSKVVTIEGPVQDPADGSILIVENAQWTTKSIETLKEPEAYYFVITTDENNGINVGSTTGYIFNIQSDDLAEREEINVIYPVYVNQIEYNNNIVTGYVINGAYYSNGQVVIDMYNCSGSIVNFPAGSKVFITVFFPKRIEVTLEGEG